MFVAALIRVHRIAKSFLCISIMHDMLKDVIRKCIDVNNIYIIGYVIVACMTNH